MKNDRFQKLILRGLSLGLLLSFHHLDAEEKKEVESDFLKLVASTNGNIAAKPMTSETLLLEINQESAELYESLDDEGKALALKLAGRGCNGQNDCKGQNACRSDKNACMGQGDCKGQTICAFSDKNLAVKQASILMAQKRKELNESSNKEKKVQEPVKASEDQGPKK